MQLDLADRVAGMQMVSSFTTSFVPGLTNFNGRNITIPADIISGTVLEPGQRFDFFDSIGEINEERGYGPGGVIINGKPEPTGAIGGGICSTSTTLFNAAMRYGLQIDKRRAHSYYISRYPLGLDATVFRSPWSRQTMAFTNDTPYPILIHASHTEKTVTFELYSIPAGRQVVLSEPEVSEVERAVIRRQYTSDLPRGRARLLQEPHDKMKVIIRRTVLGPSGEILHEDVFRSRYIRVDGIMLVGR
jgi:vancomycin resistance protein YoaR